MAGRRVCLAIGISDAGGGLEHLDGAVSGAKGVHEWAQAMGYESILLTDEGGERIDIDCVREALLQLLPFGSCTERLVLYFAGHGMISAAENGLWFQSGWRADGRVIAAELLRRNLRGFGVEHISIIEDACRKLPRNFGFARFTEDGVLGQGFTDPRAEPLVDRFSAAQDGLAAYMLPSIDAACPARCIFSGVLLEGLWGLRDDAFSKRATDQVISSSLASYLRRRVPEVAKFYGLNMVPQASPGFPEDLDIYFERYVSPPAPALPAWPSPPNSPDVEGRLRHAGRFGEQRLVEQGILELGGELPLRYERRGRFSSARSSEDRSWREMKAQTSESSERQRNRIEVAWLVERERERLAVAARERRERRQEKSTLDLIHSVPSSNDGPGLIVGGDEVVEVWATHDLRLYRSGHDSWQIPNTWEPEKAGQALIEFSDGSFGACVLMNGMTTRVAKSRGARGIAAVVMQPYYGRGEEQVERSITAAERAIARLSSKRLRADEATDLATNLRMMKHANPILGVVSAYLYDAIGDRESIRRMAYFYIENGQSIPFDIAFLGDLIDAAGHEDSRTVVVPALKARAPRTEAEAREDWTTCKTRQVRGRVAGEVPWMRRGWPFIAGTIASVETESRRFYGDEPSRQLLPSTFTSFGPRGGEGLIQLLRLERAR